MNSMNVLDSRIADSEDAMIARLCIKYSLITPEKLEQVLQQSVGKSLIYALHDMGHLDAEQVAQLLKARKKALVCPHCQEVNVYETLVGRLICEQCRHDLRDGKHMSTTDRRKKYGKYIIVREIGQGSVGIVYEAKHLSLNQNVALKVLKNDHITSHSVQRFLREAQTVAQLSHQNIVHVYDSGEEHGVPYIAMEFVKGKPLNKMIQDHEITVRRAAEITKCVAEGLEHAHKNNVIHRDIKPENIMVAEDGTPKITDFGLARHLSPEEIRLTQPNTIMGTPLYMSPEQADGCCNISALTDVYSLGVVLYEMLVGRPPFLHGDTMILLNKIIGEPPNPPRNMQGTIPKALEDICLKAIEKKPENRFASASEMKLALDQFLREPPAVTDTLPIPKEETTRRPPVRQALSCSTHIPVTQKKSMKELMMGKGEAEEQEKPALDFVFDVAIWGMLFAGLVYLIHKVVNM